MVNRTYHKVRSALLTIELSSSPAPDLRFVRISGSDIAHQPKTENATAKYRSQHVYKSVPPYVLYPFSFLIMRSTCITSSFTWSSGERCDCGI